MSNVFQINNTAGTLHITLEPGTVNGPGHYNHDSDIYLTGQGVWLWGELVNQNLYRLLENHAVPESLAQPGTPQTAGDIGLGADYGINDPVVGQTWFNTTQNKLFVFDGTLWSSIGGASVGTVPPNPAKIGDTWFNIDYYGTGNGQLMIYSSKAFNVVGVVSPSQWVIEGNHASRFAVSDTITITNNTGTGDGTYTVTQAIDTINGTTIIDVDTNINPIPIGATGDGILTHVGWGSVAEDYLLLDGSVAMIGDLNMGNNRIINVAQPVGLSDAVNKEYSDNTFVAKIGDTMTGPLGFEDPITLNQFMLVGQYSDVITGSSLLITTDGLFSTWDSYYVHIDANNDGNGIFEIAKGSDNRTSFTSLFQISNDGVITTQVSGYENLVISDNIIPNKKYVDDEIAAATSGITGDVSIINPTGAPKDGDIRVTNAPITISIYADGAWRQVWPAQYS